MLAKLNHTFQVEKFADVYDEARPLLAQHYDEVARHKDLHVLNPHLDFYQKMESLGTYLVITARVNGELSGYVSFFIQPNMHYKHVRQALSDIFFIRKDKRGIALALKMFKFAEAELKRRGVQMNYMRVKANPAEVDSSALFVYLGYEFEDKVLSKRIG